MAQTQYNETQLKELLLQMMESEIGVEHIYRAALTCAQNDDLIKEWQGYLQETMGHQKVVRSTCEALNIDPDEIVPSRLVVKYIGTSLITAMELAKHAGNASIAQLVACECVVQAETKDHANWELLARVAQAATGKSGEVLREAHRRVDKHEEHHLYHTKGWCRELWIASLGMPAVLPPPEEVKYVESAVDAALVAQRRDEML